MARYGLEGKVALVTGAARGIGSGIAERLAAEGCRLVINDVDPAALHVAQERIGQVALALAGDVADSTDVRRMFGEIGARLGGVDLLVNNAAVVTSRRWVGDITEEFYDRVLRVNIKGIFLCSRQAAAQMASRGGGAIVNLSSVGGARAFRANVPYVTSKGAVEAQTRALALDLAAYRIRVNAVGPGSIRTELWEGMEGDKLNHVLGLSPLGRPGTPADIAGAVAFLLSSDASYITGQVLYVDGGMLAGMYSPCAEIPWLIEAAPEEYHLSE